LERAGLDLRAKVTNCLWHYYTIPIFDNSCFLISSQLGLAGLVRLNHVCLGASSMYLGSRSRFAKHVLIVVGAFFFGGGGTVSGAVEKCQGDGKTDCHREGACYLLY
jgi:hypothetical protein